MIICTDCTCHNHTIYCYKVRLKYGVLRIRRIRFDSKQRLRQEILSLLDVPDKLCWDQARKKLHLHASDRCCRSLSKQSLALREHLWPGSLLESSFL